MIQFFHRCSDFKLNILRLSNKNVRSLGSPAAYRLSLPERVSRARVLFGQQCPLRSLRGAVDTHHDRRSTANGLVTGTKRQSILFRSPSECAESPFFTEQVSEPRGEARCPRTHPRCRASVRSAASSSSPSASDYKTRPAPPLSPAVGCPPES